MEFVSFFVYLNGGQKFCCLGRPTNRTLCGGNVFLRALANETASRMDSLTSEYSCIGWVVRMQIIVHGAARYPCACNTGEINAELSRCEKICVCMHGRS